MKNPYAVVIEFEDAVAKYCGAKYGVAVESCTSAIFLSLMWRKVEKGYYNLRSDISTPFTIPERTYPGVACSIIHAGGKIEFEPGYWEGEYEIEHFDMGDIWDAALRFKRGMFLDHNDSALQCLSFHIKKLLPIGRGGMVLTNDKRAAEWLRKARFDGRSPVPLQEDNFTMLGWNMYMQPDQAARGLQLLQVLGDRELPDLKVEDQKYPDLSQFEIYTK